MENNREKQLSVIDLIITVKNITIFLFSKWKIILLIGIIGGLSGILYAWLKKPKYVAVITFFTEGESKSGLGMYASLAAQFGLDLGANGGGAFEGENLMEILRSRNLVKKTLLSTVDESSKTLMIEKYLSDNEISKDWDTDKKYRHVKFLPYPSVPERLRDSILDKVYEGIVKTELKIRKRDKKVDLIDVVIESGNEYFSKRFVEILTNNAIRYYTEYKIKKSSQNVAILQKQTDSVKTMLFGNITEVAQMNDINVNPLRQIVKTGVQRKQIDVQANSILYAELLKNLELSKLSLRKETPLIQIIDQPSLPLKKIKPGRLLTGIIFAVVASFLCIVSLIFKRKLSQLNLSN